MGNLYPIGMNGTSSKKLPHHVVEEGLISKSVTLDNDHGMVRESLSVFGEDAATHPLCLTQTTTLPWSGESTHDHHHGFGYAVAEKERFDCFFRIVLF